MKIEFENIGHPDWKAIHLLSDDNLSGSAPVFQHFNLVISKSGRIIKDRWQAHDIEGDSK